MRPLTFARNYANLRRTKKQIEEGMTQAVYRETARRKIPRAGKAEPPESGLAGRLRARTGVGVKQVAKSDRRILRTVFA